MINPQQIILSLAPTELWLFNYLIFGEQVMGGFGREVNFGKEQSTSFAYIHGDFERNILSTVSYHCQD